MRLCFILPGDSYSGYFLMAWTDLVMKCAQRGHQVFVAQKPTRAECFATCASEEFDGYMCMDPSVVFTPDDVFHMLDSPHDTTCAMVMSPDCHQLTCGRTLESFVPTAERYLSVDKIDPTWIFIRSIPDGWNFTDSVPGYVDTSVRVGNRQLVTL